MAEPAIPLWVLMLALGALGTLLTIGMYMVVLFAAACLFGWRHRGQW